MSINFQNDSRINIDDKKKLKSEIEDLQKQLIESIEQDNNNKLKIKDLEIKNSELEKKNFEFQSKLQDLIIKQNLIQQEDANLKLEVKKLQLSVNSPGKVLASLGNVIKGDSKNINNEILLKEKIEMKETNEKLLLVISERESEIIKNKTISEKQLSSLKDKITELNAKINDSNNDLKDMQEQLKEKDKEIQKIEEGKNILSKYNLLKFEYEQYKKNAEKNKEINDIAREKTKEIENINKNLNQRVIKLESNFNELIKKGTIQVHDMNDLSMYVEINENLRSQIMEMQDKSDKLDKKFEESMKNYEEENKKLEEKYLEQYNQAVELQKNIDYLQESFVQGTVKLNTELSQLKSKVFEVENEKRLQEEKYNELLQNYEKAGDNFVNIQKTMTKLREKDDFDITLIEERYIVLENMLDLEKNDLITQNRELINQIKLYNENESVSSKSNVKIDKNNNYQNEIKNLRDENKLLQNKLKDKENTIFQLQKKLETFKILQQENQSLKANIKENNSNFQVIINELTTKSNQLSDELLESRKKTSLLRSIPKFKKEEVKMKVDNTMMTAEVEKYKKENDNLKKEIQNVKDEKSRIEEEYSMLKAQQANDIFAKDSEIFKYKALAKKYKNMLEEKGLLKKK